MKLELIDLNKGSVYVGDKLTIRTKFIFEKESSILWSGLRLITNPPCNKKLQIAKTEIFSRGNFEAGEYIRERSILIKHNVVPTIKARNINYKVEMLLRKINPINVEEDIIIKKTHDIKIKKKEVQAQNIVQNPLSFSISGLNVSLSKDIYRPGETIKINYSSHDLKQIEIRLLQKANLVCYCEAYGKDCRKVEELPPAIAGDVKTSNTKKGYLLLKVPEVAEPSHNYLWEPSEKEYWGYRYGDYTNWTLLLLGKYIQPHRSSVKFEVPITIVAKPVSEEMVEMDLFGSNLSEMPSLFDISSKFQKIYKIISVDPDLEDFEKYRVKIKNISNENLKGTTIKLSGLQQGLFETAPLLSGFNSWAKNEEKELVYEVKKDISAIITIIEDNSLRTIRIQTPITF